MNPIEQLIDYLTEVHELNINQINTTDENTITAEGDLYIVTERGMYANHRPYELGEWDELHDIIEYDPARPLVDQIEDALLSFPADAENVTITAPTAALDRLWRDVRDDNEHDYLLFNYYDEVAAAKLGKVIKDSGNAIAIAQFATWNTAALDVHGILESATKTRPLALVTHAEKLTDSVENTEHHIARTCGIIDNFSLTRVCEPRETYRYAMRTAAGYTSLAEYSPIAEMENIWQTVINDAQKRLTKEKAA